MGDGEIGNCVIETDLKTTVDCRITADFVKGKSLAVQAPKGITNY